MKIYELMVKFEFSWYNIRCWVPFNDSKDKIPDYHDLAELFRAFLCSDWIRFRDTSQLEIAETLGEEFTLNAVEVTNKETGMGVVFYREWP
jgi:hypothetical protein